MLHIRSSIKGVFILENNGIPSNTTTDLGESIVDGSLCIDRTNQKLYMLTSGTWTLIGGGSSFTFNNGITDIGGGTQGLGGLMIQDTTLFGNDKTLNLGHSANRFGAIFINSASVNYNHENITGDEIFSGFTNHTGFAFNTFNTSKGFSSTLNQSDEITNISSNDIHIGNPAISPNPNSQKFSISGTDGAVYRDESGNGGIRLFADYSNDFQPLSLITKQYVDNEISTNNLTISSDSTQYLNINSNELSIKALAITNVFTDNNSGTNFENWYSNHFNNLESTSGLVEEGDMLILTGITTATEVWLQNGGTNSSVLDFTRIENPSVSDTYIRSLISGDNGLTYNPSTGLMELGGALTQDTTITGNVGTHTINFGSNGNHLNEFNISAITGNEDYISGTLTNLIDKNPANVIWDMDNSATGDSGTYRFGNDSFQFTAVQSGNNTQNIQSGGTNLTLSNGNDAGTKSGRIELGNENITISRDGVGQPTSYLELQDYTRLYNDSGQIDMSTSGHFLFDNSGIGFSYPIGSEYSTSWTVNTKYDNILVNKKYVDDTLTTIPLPTIDNKNQTPSSTTLDGDTTGLTITNTPKGYVQVMVNGLQQVLGNGVKTDDCYFSGDGGTTARNILDIVATDTLYWNGSIAGFQLIASSRIDFNYNA
jgi:hypothetical protein